MKCAVCGKEELLPFKCSYCGEYFCAEHRLPEKHSCPGLFAAASPYEKEMKEVKARIRAEAETAKAIARSAARMEVIHLLIGTLLVVLVGFSLLGFPYRSLRLPLMLFFAGGFAASFLLHELAHRLVARRIGFSAHFRLDLFGALITLISAIPFSPIKFIAPGAVVVVGPASIYAMGRIAFWGPMSNLILSAVLYLFSLLPIPIPYLAVLAKLNAFIALFNLIPFGPLDGLKIMAWSRSKWLAALVLSIILLIIAW